MAVYEQLNDDDQRAVSQLARYLIETEGNRFYEQNLIAVRNHIAGNEQLIKEAHKFQKKLAEMMSEQAQAVTVIGQHMQGSAVDPVKEMMQRYANPATHKAFSERVEKLMKQRTKQKGFRGMLAALKPNRE
jgi:hypothetical protein